MFQPHRSRLNHVQVALILGPVGDNSGACWKELHEGVLEQRRPHLWRKGIEWRRMLQ